MSQIGWKRSLFHNRASTNKTLAMVIKKYAEADFKDFWPTPILLDFFPLFQILCLALYLWAFFCRGHNLKFYIGKFENIIYRQVGIALLIVFSAVVTADNYMLVCYYTNWAQYRPAPMKFFPEDLDPNLCTHVIYAFAKIGKGICTKFIHKVCFIFWLIQLFFHQQSLEGCKL